jgi:hypothetical protein
MTNHPGIRAALIAAAGTLALLGAACGANGTTASGAQAGASASTSPTAGAGEGNTGGGTGTGTGGGGGTTTNSPTPKATTATPKSSPSTASGPQIVTFKISGNASCSESGPGFSAPGTVTLTWKVTGATKVALSIDDPTFFGTYGTGSFSTYGATDTQTIPFACNVASGQTATHKYTLDTMDGGAHRSMTISASAVNHGP